MEGDRAANELSEDELLEILERNKAKAPKADSSKSVH